MDTLINIEVIRFGAQDAVLYDFDDLILDGADIIGTSGAKTLTGTKDSEFIEGSFNEDVIIGGSGRDFVNGL